MKRNILITGAFVLASGILILNGCSKDDTTAPDIKLIGASSMTIALNGSYSEQGATATDEEDGTVTVTDNHDATNPNVNLAGTYFVTYTATDAAGNTANATRTVIVENDAAYLEGTYTSTEGVSTWTQTVTADATHNNRIVFQYFAYYVTTPLNPKIYAQVTGSAVEIATPQTTVGGASGCTHIISGDGAPTFPIALVGGKYKFSVKFTDTENNTGGGCPGTGAVPYEDILIQQ